jgi:hypothetical protein
MEARLRKKEQLMTQEYAQHICVNQIYYIISQRFMQKFRSIENIVFF